MSEQDRIAFEKVRLNVLGVIDKRILSDGNYLDSETQKDWMLWQASTAEANKRIAELEGTVFIKTAFAEERDKKISELQASNNALREVGLDSLPFIDDDEQRAKLSAIINSTPAESLQAHDDVLSKERNEIIGWIKSIYLDKEFPDMEMLIHELSNLEYK